MTTVPLQPFQITDPRWPKLPQSTRMLEEVLRILGGRTNQAGQELDRWRRQCREKRIAAATPLNQGPTEGSAEKRWREREKDTGLAAKSVVGSGVGEALARGVTSRESRWLRR